MTKNLNSDSLREFYRSENKDKISLSNDILQYVLNPYLNFMTDISEIEKVFDRLKFLEKPHFRFVKNVNRLYNLVTYRDNKQIKIVYFWDENKIKSSEEIFDDQELIKERRRWHNNGSRGTLEYFKDGLQHGKEYIWHDNGILAVLENYENGLRHGHRYHYSMIKGK